jgi:RNA polymerase sigma factor (sigma-70 family)
VCGINLGEASAQTLDELAVWIETVPESLPAEVQPMARTIVAEMREPIERLQQLGLGYLALDRASSTLSTGERQRVQLARSVRNRTTGVLYVLDEPSIGLHPANVEGLLGVMVNGDRYDPERSSLSTFVTTVAQTWLLGRVFQADARNCRRVNFEAMSLDEPTKRGSDHGEARTLAELIPDETNLEAELIWRSDVERAHRLLDRLDPRTADVLRRRFSDEPDTLQDIADDLGCTKEWVRQIEERGLKRLRNMFGK